MGATKLNSRHRNTHGFDFFFSKKLGKVESSSTANTPICKWRYCPVEHSWPRHQLFQLKRLDDCIFQMKPMHEHLILNVVE